MPSFSNRPGYGEPLPLSSDYQAVGYANPSIPRAPRSPHFPSPTGPFQPGQSGGHSYAQTGPFPASQPSARGIPNAPNSLSPMAMSSARSAVATGPQQTMDAGPSRPSAKAGMSILFAGAIIGGLIGAVMHARQNAADAFAANHDPVPMVASASASVPPPLAPTVIPPPDQLKADKLADKKDADKKDADKKDADKADKKTKTAKKWGGGGGAKVKVTEASGGGDEEPAAPVAKKGKKAAADKDDDGYTVASADGKSGGDKAEKPAEKPAEKEKTTKKSSGDKEPSPKSDKPKGGGKGGDDAVNVLKAAMGATENTL